MIEAIIAGFFLGLGLVFITGPLFFALLSISLESGRLKAQMFGLGIWISDLLVSIGLFFMSKKLENWINWEHPSMKILAFCGGLVIAIIGAVYFKGRRNSLDNLTSMLPKSKLLLFTKGFAINTFNPFTFFFWFGVISTAQLGQDMGSTELLLMITTIIVTIILGDLSKIFLADYYGNLLSSIWIRRINEITGIIFMAFGLYLMSLAFRPNIVF